MDRSICLQYLSFAEMYFCQALFTGVRPGFHSVHLKLRLHDASMRSRKHSFCYIYKMVQSPHFPHHKPIRLQAYPAPCIPKWKLG